MATADSIFHFRIAATMLSPWEYKSGAYSKEDLDGFAYRSRHVWWNREAVDWIDQESFPRLSPEKVEKLRTLIATFLTGIVSTRTASQEKTLVARDALLEIFELVGERIYDQSVTNAAIILTKEIRDLKYGGFFKTFDIQFDESWTGDPIIVVWLVVEDSAPDDPGFRAAYSLFEEELLLRMISKGLPDRSVSLRLRTVTEQGEFLMGESD